jgi:hypothetical protein
VNPSPRSQFTAIRDGDWFFFLHDPALGEIKCWFGIHDADTRAGSLRSTAPGMSPGEVGPELAERDLVANNVVVGDQDVV